MGDPIDLDRLAAELTRPGGGTPSAGETRLDDWLRLVADRSASDLLLVAGEPPALRIEGRIERVAAGAAAGRVGRASDSGRPA